MSRLDAILHSRLERIREELDSYISLRYAENDSGFISPIARNITEDKKSDGIFEKFLSPMKLNEDAYEDDYFDDSDDYLLSKLEEENPEGEPIDQLARPDVRPSAYTFVGTPSDEISIPELTKRDKKHLDEVLEKKEESFSEMLLRLIDQKGLKDSDVYKRANIDRRLFSKIRSDADYVPSKKTAISFCLALQLEIEEAKKLLSAAGYTLSSSSRFDLIIMFLIENCEYNIHFANIVLDDYGEGTLSR